MTIEMNEYGGMDGATIVDRIGAIQSAIYSHRNQNFWDNYDPSYNCDAAEEVLVELECMLSGILPEDDAPTELELSKFME